MTTRRNHAGLMATDVHVRPLRDADVPALILLINGLASHHGDLPRVSHSSLARDALGPHPWLSVLVLEREGSLLGYSALCPRAQLHFGIRGMDIHHLFLVEEARGLGLGRVLIDASVSFAAEKHCAFVVVSTNPDNADAQSFYLACGFEAFPNDASRFRRRLPVT